MMSSKLVCPVCLSDQLTTEAPGGFMEMGGWTEKGYDVEADLTQYRCPNGHGFFLMDQEDNAQYTGVSWEVLTAAHHVHGECEGACPCAIGCAVCEEM